MTFMYRYSLNMARLDFINIHLFNVINVARLDFVPTHRSIIILVQCLLIWWISQPSFGLKVSILLFAMKLTIF
jgi:hypothetical protein